VEKSAFCRCLFSVTHPRIVISTEGGAFAAAVEKSAFASPHPI
jgi:hypothetical protein